VRPSAAPPPARPPSSGASGPQPASRKPEKGAVTPERKAKVQEPTQHEPPKPGERVCPNCGAGNDPERKFCRRCGNTLDPAAIAAAAAAQSQAEPAAEKKRRGPGFLSRIGRSAQREASMAASNPSSLASAPSRLRMRGSFLVYALLGALGLGAIASYLYVPEVGDTVGDVRYIVESRMGDRTPFEPTEARARSEPGFPAANMIDAPLSTWWAGNVSDNRRWQLDFAFAEPTDVNQVNLDIGAHDEARERFGRPREFQIRADGQLTGTYTLADLEEQQQIEIGLLDLLKLRGVTDLRIIVNSAYAGRDGDDVIAIRNVDFVGPTS
jgi:hypothetical protein